MKPDSDEGIILSSFDCSLGDPNVSRVEIAAQAQSPHCAHSRIRAGTQPGLLTASHMAGVKRKFSFIVIK